jgi:hypothetical protein
MVDHDPVEALINKLTEHLRLLEDSVDCAERLAL